MKVVSTNQNRPIADPSIAVKVPGLPGLIPRNQTIADTLEASLKVEKEWSENGVDFKNLKNNVALQTQVAGGNTDVVFTG